jgi:hypothetical protein
LRPFTVSIVADKITLRFGDPSHPPPVSFLVINDRKKEVPIHGLTTAAVFVNRFHDEYRASEYRVFAFVSAVSEVAGVCCPTPAYLVVVGDELTQKVLYALPARIECNP